ncbi:uncharacterized protein LOC111322752 [Stylophora pistillata]|uniref:uncharacterized protein LOC111322752 n=1 Tax=Stylophora pistillata TaxID=50429 RepID=UPI000C054512|nr:uncharacterized protein LOC111322752 [Stylophora pistillata]
MRGSKDEEETSTDTAKNTAVTRNYTDQNCVNGRKLFNAKCIIISAYFVFLLWRFISLGLYSVYATDCFLRAKLATLRCENFTLYSNPTRFEVAWQMSSAVNNFIAVGILFKLPEFPGLNVVCTRLIKLARFWSFIFQLVVVISYNLMLFFHEHLVESAMIEVGFIVDEITVTIVVCLWNFVPAPSNRSQGLSCLQVAYNLTLVMLFLENFFLFLLMSSQAALDITGIHEFETRSKGLQALGIVFNATEATFYFAVMKFMWNKLFEGEAENLLKKDTI